MLGDSHCFVANLSLACLNEEERHILYPRWGGIEAGATLSDYFRIMWEPVNVNNQEKQLVHRCYIDSDDEKDHGCLTRAQDHTEGSICFIKDYMKGDLDDSYTEDQFLENLGMFLGIACHHIADLCTPVHVGHNINFFKIGFNTLSKFHKQVERDILRYQRKARIELHVPKIVQINKHYFKQIASQTYKNQFLKLCDIYQSKDPSILLEMISGVLSSAVKHTASAWHTVLVKSKMTDRSWSMQPLL